MQGEGKRKEENRAGKALRALMAALLFAAAVVLAGCSRGDQIPGYVEGVLNASFKRDYGDYAYFTGTDESQARALHEEMLASCLAPLEEEGLSEKLLERYESLFVRMMGASHYRVGEADKKWGGGYEVEIWVEPYTMFTHMEEDYQEALDRYYRDTTRLALRNDVMPSNEQELKEDLYELRLDLLMEAMDQVRYGQEEVFLLRVEEEKPRHFSVNQEDLEDLRDLLIDRESMGI